MMRAFIYDMDGVIVDSEIIHMKAEKILLEHYGIQADEALLMPYRGTSDAAMFEDIRLKYNAAYDVEGIVAEKDVLMRRLLQEEELVPTTDPWHSLKRPMRCVHAASIRRLQAPALMK